MKSILVTGGADFLEPHLCERLIREGTEFICVDNFLSGQKNNIAHMLNNTTFDVLSPVSVWLNNCLNENRLWPWMMHCLKRLTTLSTCLEALKLSSTQDIQLQQTGT